jgi:hypothetical protein
MDTDLVARAAIYAGFASPFVKLFVDGVKYAVDVPRWALPALAWLSGIGFVLVILLANGIVIDAQTAAQALLAGTTAGGGAILLTEFGRKADERREERAADRVIAQQRADAALLRRRDRPTGTG